jgi:hypothetical protein
MKHAGQHVSSLDQLLAGEGTGPEKPNIIAAIRKIGANKDLRIFLTSICKYSKSDWASYGRALKILYSVMQSSILIKEDSALMNEITSIPHIAVFFKRLNESDI